MSVSCNPNTTDQLKLKCRFE